MFECSIHPFWWKLCYTLGAYITETVELKDLLLHGLVSIQVASWFHAVPNFYDLSASLLKCSAPTIRERTGGTATTALFGQMALKVSYTMALWTSPTLRCVILTT